MERMKTNHRARLLLAILLPALFAPVALAGPPIRWIDVRVEREGGKAPLALHVPASLAGAALGALEIGAWNRGMVHLGPSPEGLPAWNAVLAMLAAMEPGQSLSLEASGVRVRARRAGETVRIHAVREGEAPADLRIVLPVEVLAGLAVDENGDLDLHPVLDRLDSFPPGDVITGRDRGTTVRVRID